MPRSQSAIYAGFAILELSKGFVYDFHYNFVKNKYGNNATLLFTDTDSLTYHIKTEDIYCDMKAHMNLFDTSNYPNTHHLYSNVNMKVPGKMTDETAGAVIKEFVGLRAKMYSILEANGKCKKVGKGVLRYVLEKVVKHDDYKKSIFQKVIQSASMSSIRSFNHNLYTINQRKITLSPFDDKRYVLDDGYHTLAHGHCNIIEIYELDRDSDDEK